MQELRQGFLSTIDRVRIAFEHDMRGRPNLVIVCPGFFNSTKNRWMKATTEILSKRYDTLIFDFRGHGRSSGIFSWLRNEGNDLEVILEYAKKFNYASIGILAYSMGAATCINTLKDKEEAQSLVLVSTPASFWGIDYHFWELEMFSDLKDNFECGWEGKGARVGSIFLKKPKPISRIKLIKDIPIMFVHGSRDWIIKDYHSRKLYNAYRAAADIKKLVVIKGGLHAERLIQYHRERMEELIFGWFERTLGLLGP